jgi:hypothetical protein
VRTDSELGEVGFLLIQIKAAVLSSGKNCRQWESPLPMPAFETIELGSPSEKFTWPTSGQPNPPDYSVDLRRRRLRNVGPIRRATLL